MSDPRTLDSTHPHEDEDAVEARPLQNAGGDDTVVEPAALPGQRVQVDDDEDDDSDVLRRAREDS